MIVAAGWLLVITRSTGSTVSVLGATPKLHIRTAPLQTCCGIGSALYSRTRIKRRGFIAHGKTVSCRTKDVRTGEPHSITAGSRSQTAMCEGVILHSNTDLSIIAGARHLAT